MSKTRGQIRVPSAKRWLSRKAFQTVARCAPSSFNKYIQRPCFLIGCPRSGTSFFDQVFATHPQIASYPSEALELWHPNCYPWRTKALGRDFPPIWADAETYTQYAVAQHTKATRQHVRASFGAFSRWNRGKQFVNKCTMIGLMLPTVVELFPDAKFIHIVRDGRASALSWAKRQRAEMERHPTAFDQHRLNYDTPQLIEACSAAWKSIVDAIDDFKATRGDAWLQVRYEDFCQDPTNALHAAARLVGIDPQAFAKEAIADVASQNYKFKTEIPATQLESLNRRLGESLRRFGYEVG